MDQTNAQGFQDLAGALLELAFARLEVAANFERRGLFALCGWMRETSQDEWSQASALTQALRRAGMDVKLEGLQGQSLDCSSPVAALVAIVSRADGVSEKLSCLSAQLIREDEGPRELIAGIARSHEERAARLHLIEHQVRMLGNDDRGLHTVNGLWEQLQYW